MMKRVLVGIVVVGLLLVGCQSIAENAVEGAIERGLEAEGGGNVDLEFDDEGGTIEIQTEDGESTINIGGGDIPDGFGMPVPNGGEVVGTMSFGSADGTRTSVTLEYPPSALDELVETYEAYFAAFEEAFNSQTSDAGSQLWSWGTSDGSQTAAVTAYDGDDYVTVALVETSEG